MARAAGGRVLSPGIAGQGMNPFVIDRGDSEELLQRIGSLRRLIEVMVGERLSAERRSSLDHALAGYYAEARERTGFRDFYQFLQNEARRQRHRPPAAPLRHRQPAASPLRRGRRPADPRGPGHRLRPAPAGTGTAPRRRDGLHRDGVGRRRPGPPPPPAGGGRGVVASCSTRRARPSWSAWPSAPASTGWGLQFITQDVQDLLSEDSSRAITGHSGRALAAERRLQAPAPAGCRRDQHGGRSLRPAGGPATLAPVLSRAGDGLLLAQGNRFPVRIEATPEETEVIEWRPGPTALTASGPPAKRQALGVKRNTKSNRARQPI